MEDETLDFEDAERSYRRGFAQGAWEVIDAVRGALPDADMERLDLWIEAVRLWLGAAYVGSSKRRPGFHVTYDILPPKIGWPFTPPI